jgi:hypothetical protein
MAGIGRLLPVSRGWNCRRDSRRPIRIIRVPKLVGCSATACNGFDECECCGKASAAVDNPSEIAPLFD